MLTDNELIELEKLVKEDKIEKARDNFWQFCLYMDYNFFKLREGILKQIAREMQRLIKPIPPDSELDILNVSLCPRTGKSYLCTLFCAWCLGNRPSESIMRNTVTAKLYFKFSGDLKQIVQGESHLGRYNEVFPDIKMATSALEGWRLEQSKQGVSYFGAGIEGSIIGFGASMLSILDDSVKDEFDALNENSLEKKWGWYGSAADSREEKSCKKLFIGTRWSKKDIVGRLKELGYFSKDNAKEIVVPAVIDGHSYCEEIHTTKKLERTKRITSRIIWLAEWMQQPIEAEGLLFPPHELKYFKKDFLKDRKPDAIISWCDVADEGSDFLAYCIGYIIDNNLYLADVVFTQERIEVSKNKVVKATMDHDVQVSYFESNNGGKGYALEVARLLKGLDSKTIVKWQVNRQNKETRILVGSELIKSNFYFLKQGEYEEGSEYDLFMKQFTSYSHLGKNTHDDAADSINSLCDLYKSITRNKATKKERNVGCI